MGRYLLLTVVFIGVICLPISSQAQGQGRSEPSLEEILSIILGTLSQSAPFPGAGEKVYAEEEVTEGFVASRFEAILHRKPAEQELATFKGRLMRGFVSEEELVTTLFTSDEYFNRREDDRAYVRTLFVALFDRGPRRSEHDLYTRLLNRGAMTRLQLREELFMDAEFQAGQTARKTLVKYGRLSPILREFAAELDRKASAMAEQVSRGGRRNDNYLRDMEGMLQGLADEARQVRELAESGSTQRGYYFDMAEDMRYLLYSIDKGMGYSSELDYLDPSWKDTKRLALMLVRLMRYAGEERGEVEWGRPSRTR